MWWRLRLNFVDNLCFDKRFVVSLTIGFWREMKCHFLNIFFNNHDHWPWLWPRRYWPWPQPRRELALASKRTGLGLKDYWPWPWPRRELALASKTIGLGLEENWPWPRRELALASKTIGLGLGLEERTGLGLSLEHYWPWPQTCCPRTHPCSKLPEFKGINKCSCSNH